MKVELRETAGEGALAVHVVRGEGDGILDSIPEQARNWARRTGFKTGAGNVLLVPGRDGELCCAVLALGKASDPLAAGTLAKHLPEGHWRLEGLDDPSMAMLGAALGSYAFNAYRKPARDGVVSLAGGGAADAERTAASVFMVRDLINTPASDMGPESLEKAVRDLAGRHGADVSVTTGDELLGANFPMIHAVGRAAAQAPRLVDMRWGSEGHPRVTLVGKGVCFDTGGLDIKPASGMLLMKKDMGGAANVLGLARMIMERRLPVRLRVLVPAVENAISANAFRPGDILRSRKGISVEIGNTDAEGRLVLADALALACEENPQLLVDMATLTGAARVALGAEIAPFYTGSGDLAAALESAAASTCDPVWRMPLFDSYDDKLSSKVADMNNVTSDGFAGSVTAALFLRRFVSDPASWMHFDIYGWNPVARPHCPVGGEAQAIRALDAMIASRFA